MKAILKERFSNMVDALLASDLSLTKAKIAEKMLVSRAVLSNHLNPKRPVPEDFIEDFITTFSLNREYFETGLGNPLTKTVNESNNLVAETDYNKTSLLESDTTIIGEMPEPGEENKFIDVGNGRFIMIVPLVPIKAYAGYVDNYDNQEFFEGLAVHSIPVTSLVRGHYMAFVVKGESMSNGSEESINEGNIVTGREIQKHHWRNKLHLHRFEDYVIVHRDGIVTKRIIAHDVELGIITCHSLNPDKNRFPDYDINLDECIQIFNIVAVTKTK